MGALINAWLVIGGLAFLIIVCGAIVSGRSKKAGQRTKQHSDVGD
jgi:hypothetical protein